MKKSRRIDSKTLTLGTPETFNLPRNNPIRDILLRLHTGTITLAGGSASGVVKPNGTAQLLSNIKVVVDGSYTPVSIPGWLLYELNKFLYGTAPYIISPADGAAQVATALNAHLIIPFENVLGVKPFDTLMGGHRNSSLQLMVDTTGVSALFSTANDRTKTNPTQFILDVGVNEEVSDAGSDIDVKDFVYGGIKMYLAQKVAVTGASSSFQIKPLTVGNRYKGFMLFVEDADAGSDTIINNIRLASGSEFILDRRGLDIKRENKVKLGIETMSTGAYYLDLMPDGLLNQTLDVRPISGRQTLEFELDVAAPGGTCYIYVVALEYVPAMVVEKKAAAAAA